MRQGIGEWLIRKIAAISGARPYASVSMPHSAIWSIGRMLSTFRTDKQNDVIIFRDSAQRAFLAIVTTDRASDVVDKAVRAADNKPESTYRRPQA